MERQAVLGRKLTRRERNFLRHRAEILDAAEAVFADKGYVAATMEEIAQRAEFAVGTLYKFFDNKADLYSGVLLSKADLLQEVFEESLGRASTPLEKVKACFRVRVGMFWRDPLFFRILFDEVHTTIQESRAVTVPELMDRYRRFLEELHLIFEAAVETGEIRPVDVSAIVLSFEGIIRAYLVKLSQSRDPVRNEEEEELLLSLFLHGVSEPPS
jgi:AcrR family transcriptional regulator